MTAYFTVVRMPLPLSVFALENQKTNKNLNKDVCTLAQHDLRRHQPKKLLVTHFLLCPSHMVLVCVHQLN